MTEPLNPASDRAAYNQIADRLRGQILRGELAPGAKLPTEQELAEHFGVSRATARQAITVLKSEGRVDSLRGRGVFVREQALLVRLGTNRLSRAQRKVGQGAFLTDVAPSGRTARVEVDVSRGPLPDDLADHLGVESGTEVLIRRRRMFADTQPMQLATSYLPLELVAGTAIEQEDTGPGGTYARLEEQGIRLARFLEQVSVRQPTPAEVEALQLGRGVSLLRVLRTAYATDGRAVEVNEMLLRADAYELVYEVPAQ